MSSSIRPADDEQISVAHIVEFVEHDHLGWLVLAWNVAISEETINSTMLQIAETPVESRDQGQVGRASQQDQGQRDSPLTG